MRHKIVFVNPAIGLKRLYGYLSYAGATEPPLGLCYLASVVRKRGYDTTIIDGGALKIGIKQTLDLIFANKPSCVGITAVTCTIVQAAILANRIKERDPKVTVIIGGPHVTALPEETLIENPSFDIAVLGEGEETMGELLAALEHNSDLKEIDGLAFRDNEDIVLTNHRSFIDNLDSLPYPALDLLPRLDKHYRTQIQSVNKLPSFSLVTSRGCNSRCKFCDRSVFGNRVRFHSAEYVINMLKELKRYGIRSVTFEDDNFLIPKSKLRDFASKMKEENLNLSWDCVARVDDIDYDTLKLAKDSGCWRISFGIESGSQRILDFYDKRITLGQVKNVIRLTKEAGISPKGMFMFGNSLETETTLCETTNLMLNLPLDDVAISFFIPYPGSEIYSTASKYGRFERDWERMSDNQISFVPSGLKKELLEFYQKLAYRKFYFRPRIIYSHLKHLWSYGLIKELFLSFLTFLVYIFKSSKSGPVKS